VTDCRDCAEHAQDPSWAGYTAGCEACKARAFTGMSRWDEYTQRARTWLQDNPSAYPAEYETACARIAEELGL